MIEELLSLAILSELNLLNKTNYLEKLDAYFDLEPENDLLLSLEYLFGDTHDVIYKIFNATSYELDADLFGKLLFSYLKKVYLSGDFPLVLFGQKMYLLWNLYIPHHLANQEPFWTLSYADDCLSYGDETQTRVLYEEAFNYYV